MGKETVSDKSPGFDKFQEFLFSGEIYLVRPTCNILLPKTKIRNMNEMPVYHMYTFSSKSCFKMSDLVPNFKLEIKKWLDLTFHDHRGSGPNFLLILIENDGLRNRTKLSMWMHL